MRILIFILLFSGLHDLYAQNAVNEDNIIYWHERKLTWDDFVVKRGPLEEFGGHAETASGVTTYFWIEDECLEYDIPAFFNKNKSLLVGLPSDRLLSHEQHHFDISELCARKMRKLILEEFDDLDKFEAVKKKVEELLAAMSDYHRLYDKETAHSAEVPAQLKWEKKINDELYELRAYSKPKDKVEL